MNGGLYKLKREQASSGARFGLSLLKLGRFDGDKYEDFAVGAPYEDNGIGAVYIYNGGGRGIQTTFSQRITPSEFPLYQWIRGFGISIAGNADVDGNNFSGRFCSLHLIQYNE